MIVLLHPRATSPRSRRYPLSILRLAAVLEGREEYAIVDGNVDPDPSSTLEEIANGSTIELLAVSVMPGPQMVAAIPLCRAFRERHPEIPIAWGGYFPSLYPETALAAPYVDFAVRGQGEETLPELVAALRGARELAGIRGLSWRGAPGAYVHNPERLLQAPDAFPPLPYHRLDADRYLRPSFLGRRTAVHEASAGCPYACNFCGVISAYGSREKMEAPERTAAALGHLKESYGADAVQFYDNNFFLREDHARELAARLEPLALRWWCEARIDILLSYSDDTLQRIRRSGAAMIFFGAESGSDWVLRAMNKRLETRQTLELARRLRHIGIVPEFSFVVGNPSDPERDARECIAFIRRIKNVNPDSEIIVQHYIPTPQRESMYGGVDGRITFPSTPEEWATPRWYNFTVRTDPQLPWLPKRVQHRIDDFERVVQARWPTIQDTRLPRWGRLLLQALGSWRYGLGVYAFPYEIAWTAKMIDLRKPRVESL